MSMGRRCSAQRAIRRFRPDPDPARRCLDGSSRRRSKRRAAATSRWARSSPRVTSDKIRERSPSTTPSMVGEAPRYRGLDRPPGHPRGRCEEPRDWRCVSRTRLSDAPSITSSSPSRPGSANSVVHVRPEPDARGPRARHRLRADDAPTRQVMERFHAMFGIPAAFHFCVPLATRRGFGGPEANLGDDVSRPVGRGSAVAMTRVDKEEL